MAIALLQLTLCVVSAIRLTSSQPTCDIAGEDSTCPITEHMWSQLETANSQLQTSVSQLQAAVSHQDTTVSRLLNDVADLKAYVYNQKCNVSGSGCDAGFTSVPSVNGCYQLVTRNLNWNAAGQNCRSLHKDAHLLVINDAQEQAAIERMLNFTCKTSVSGCYQDGYWGVHIWTAGQRIDTSRESEFIWRVKTADATEVSQMNYTHWAKRQPDYWRNSEACMRLVSARSYKWNDAPCYAGYCSICEIDNACP